MLFPFLQNDREESDESVARSVEKAFYKLSEKRCKNRRKALQQRSLTHQRIIFLCVE
jgi:hypothetical protein